MSCAAAVDIEAAADIGVVADIEVVAVFDTEPERAAVTKVES